MQARLRTAVIDARVLGQLVDRYAVPLELYARGWCDAPQDVVQEAFLQLVRQQEFPHHVGPWLYRVVRNRAVSRCRSRQRRLKHELRAATQSPTWFSPAAENRLDAETATAKLASLPSEQREVIVTHIWGGLTFEQIGQLMGTSASTAHRRYQAGLVALREKLGVTWLTKNPSIPT